MFIFIIHDVVPVYNIIKFIIYQNLIIYLIVLEILYLYQILHLTIHIKIYYSSRYNILYII